MQKMHFNAIADLKELKAKISRSDEDQEQLYQISSTSKNSALQSLSDEALFGSNNTT